jgi:hypothetical protein
MVLSASPAPPPFSTSGPRWVFLSTVHTTYAGANVFEKWCRGQKGSVLFALQLTRGSYLRLNTLTSTGHGAALRHGGF